MPALFKFKVVMVSYMYTTQGSVAILGSGSVLGGPRHGGPSRECLRQPAASSQQDGIGGQSRSDI